ncbi:MAG: HD domain-containing protein [Lachnospiraceae bacterium]|jgi:3'-5' exoribonuclease|nr:HD domain-containing protein [Lachnospiraceae bacterium]MBR7014820.1 HD domain-containing protein [Lachnospiraceae bacterium]MEE1109744.1 HD domain-containing protein [Lachnospiraceae bacterium]MEE3377535.1 HD domain-containing protein [Lachnospiraceae bacterium]
MRYISELRDGSRIQDVYLVKHKQSAVTKNGRNYENVILQDKTGQLDAKIWDPNSDAIHEFDVLDYVYVAGSVSMFNGALQASLKQVRKADPGEYIAADYLPMTKKNRKVMFNELLKLIGTVENPYLSALLKSFFVEDRDFIIAFAGHSAAKTVHHSFVGGLLEHTLSVTKLCDYFASTYPAINRDLLLTAAMLHDIGKVSELSDFPVNEYTDDGQLLGHIMIGAEMVHDHVTRIPDFPKKLETEVKHCILAHHGEYEYGSPKKPAIIEALALNLADNTDAKLETMTEVLESASPEMEWLGFNRFFDSNLRRTGE